MVYGSLVPAIKELWTTASRHKRAETKKGPRMEGLSLYCVVSYRLAELVDYETGTQLGLKPSGLGGHDVAGVGNVDNLFHADGIEGEGDLHFAVVHTTFQLAEATDATAYDWLWSGLLNNVHTHEGDFSQVERITHTGALLIGTYDNFTDGDPVGFLTLINSHMPTADRNKLIFIEHTGHTYQMKQQELADQILLLLRSWLPAPLLSTR